jgi:hypothetical protein
MVGMVARAWAVFFVGLCGCSYSPLKLTPGDVVTGGEPSQSHGDQPGNGDEVQGDPRGDDQSAGDPSTGDPGDPPIGDSLTGDPWSGDPPWTGDPGDALPGDPPWSGDPLSGDPWWGDPWAGDPLTGDSWWGDPWWGDPWGDAGLSGDGLQPSDAVLAGDISPACKIAPACTSDATPGLTAGHVAIGEASDLVPLCNGTVLLAHTNTNSIGVFNTSTQTETATYALSGAPFDLELDPDHSLLYATLVSEAKVAQIDLTTHAVRTIDLDADGIDLAAGNNGQMFVTQDGSTILNDVGVIDGCTRKAVTRTPGNVRDLAVYDRDGAQLVTGSRAVSPDRLTRFSVDEASGDLTYDNYRAGTGGNCRDLAISPDGDHIAYACGGGNGPGYTIHDLRTDDFVTLGEFSVGAFPTCAAFDPTGRNLAASNGDSVAVYDVATHVEISTPSLDLTTCTNGSVVKLAYSRGGAFLFALVDCSADNFLLYWWTF